MISIAFSMTKSVTISVIAPNTGDADLTIPQINTEPVPMPARTRGGSLRG
jgi:hypothetical protein